MNVLEFIVTVVLVSVSGALTPGPMFFANLSKGVKLGARSGLIFAVSHTMVELTLVLLLSFGLVVILDQTVVKTIIGILGGCMLVLFGLAQVFSSLKPRLD